LGEPFGLVAGIAERTVSLMITVLNLGGTIALTYDDEVPVTLSAAELLGESDAEMVDLDPVQSNGLSWAHLLAVRHELLSIVAAGASDAVLITGTDTVEDVGNFLHLTAPPGLRIALVCSLDTATRGQRAPGIEAALTWLRSGADAGLQLFVDGNAYSVPFEKYWTGSRWDFAASPDTLPPWRVPTQNQLDPVMPTVIVIPAGIGCGQWASAVIGSVPSAGIVLEAFGSGDIPPDLVPSIESYLRRGAKVVITSLAPHGRVEPMYPAIVGTSHELLKAGVYSAGTLTARQARIRLAVELASDASGEVLQAFERFATT